MSADIISAASDQLKLQSLRFNKMICSSSLTPPCNTHAMMCEHYAHIGKDELNPRHSVHLLFVLSYGFLGLYVIILRLRCTQIYKLSLLPKGSRINMRIYII